MITTELYNGQGLGNQLWCFAVTKTIAEDNGFEFGIQCPERFKAKNFMKVDFGKSVIGGTGPEGGPPTSLPENIKFYYRETMLRNNLGNDVSKFDPSLISIQDYTKIDGIMQCEKYIYHKKKELIDFFKVDEYNEFSEDDICVIHFRGGDYKYAGNTILPQSYYSKAIDAMKQINPNMRFFVVTDDRNLASHYFSGIATLIGGVLGGRDSSQADFHIGGDVGLDYRILNNVKYLILSNSSFSWWTAWTNIKCKFTIAPKYWAAYNYSDGFWSTGEIYTKGWNYINRFNDNIQTYEEVIKEI